MDQSSKSSSFRFEYNDEIFVSCAESLEPYPDHNNDDELLHEPIEYNSIDTEDHDTASSSSSSSSLPLSERTRNKRQEEESTTATTTDTKHHGTEEEEYNHYSPAPNNSNTNEPTASHNSHPDDNCRVLFELHQLHYHRTTTEQTQTQSNHRYSQFLTTVRLIHRHNNNNNTVGRSGGGGQQQQQQPAQIQRLFTMRLNQFSDLGRDHPQVPQQQQSHAATDADTDTDADTEENQSNWYSTRNQMIQDMNTLLEDAITTTTTIRRQQQKQQHPTIVRLDSLHDIRNAIPKNSFFFFDHEPTSNSPTHDPITIAAAAAAAGHPNDTNDNTNDERLILGPWHSTSATTTDIDTGTAPMATTAGKGTNTNNDAIQDFVLNDDNHYRTQLNWATEHNPDGVVLVHPASFQGACGSCWAFAATGTLEASISRHSAYNKLQSILSTTNNNNNNNNYSQKNQQDTYNEQEYLSSTVEYQASSMSSAFKQRTAITTAQNTERAIFQRARLSVQELIDCDNKHDHGCTGGNPLLAYPFIHRYGLVSESLYPYMGSESKCRRKEISTPSSSTSSFSAASYTSYSEWDQQQQQQQPIDIATANSWGVLAPNDEGNMESVLRYVGPIAVGFDGSDPSFLGYSGGVYDGGGCSTHLNHALLIVGYSEVEDGNGGLIKYWIARNSWGEGWGENGYVRIKRGGSKKESFGVCGIAKNPNVALGGYFLPVDDGDAILGTAAASTTTNDNTTPPLSTTMWEGETIDGGGRRPGVRTDYETRLDHSRLSSGSSSSLSTSTPRFDANWLTMCGVFVAIALGLIVYRRNNYRKRIRCMLPSTRIADINSSEKNCIVESSTSNNTMYGSIDNSNGG